MAPASNEEQFKFLISCIRYSNNGKVDFGQVAKECGICTKGAAAKRYERLMRAHGISSNSTNTKPVTPTKSKPERKDSTSGNKKRKLADLEEDGNNGGDDDENFGDMTQTSIVKSEKKKNLARITTQSVKFEKDAPKSAIMTSSPVPLDEAADLMQFYPAESGSQSFSDASFSSARDFDFTSGDFGRFGRNTSPTDEHSIFSSSFNGLNSYPDSDPLGLFAPGIQRNIQLQAPVVPSNDRVILAPVPRSQMASQVFRNSQFSPFSSTALSDNPVVLE
ncbi:hypothetical protein HYALB_00004627 [Hymenoscyphus albidus]|uniref:Myb-like DNA-binding domain-containing protein n=1 Tax=Hymenoscyphus albidus TaxID=595503 RepID=A0A9N9M3N0_9HELO|nr:hypothetical protein HYALB_00004627 [Hymenoscyphus albidus]